MIRLNPRQIEKKNGCSEERLDEEETYTRNVARFFELVAVVEHGGVYSTLVSDYFREECVIDKYKNIYALRAS